MNVVIDTNVLVSGICFPKSACGRVLRLESDVVRFIWSEVLIAEVAEVLARPKFERFLPMDRRFDTADALVASGPAFALGDPMRLCRDPNDDHLLELARVGKASYLVTGDRDLLVLDSVHETRIVSPAMFLAVARV